MRYLSIAFALLCNVLVHGFTNPIKTYNGSDPQMVFHDGIYYLTSTSWSDVEITSASTIEGLKSAVPQVIYTDNSTERGANWWAPEIWQIDGTWYIYFTAGVKDSSWDVMLRTLNIWVLRGGSDTPTSDPYSLVGELRPANDVHGMLDGVSPIYTRSNLYEGSTDRPERPPMRLMELVTSL